MKPPENHKDITTTKLHAMAMITFALWDRNYVKTPEADSHVIWEVGFCDLNSRKHCFWMELAWSIGRANTWVVVPKEQLEMSNSTLTSSTIADCLTSCTWVSDWLFSGLVLCRLGVSRKATSSRAKNSEDRYSDTPLVLSPFIQEQVYVHQQWYDLALGMIKMFQRS